ncbi:YddF family protein [Brassicibacter mesophilus]|uniref:YddF family protein n=1 Tax=Brassicibacter mesophilus TaxID=745119 RepID=UPI003D21E7E1
MIKDTNLPIALFNGTVATTNGIYSIQNIDIETARKYVEQNGFISAIGHEATAQIMSELLGKEIPMNRIQFHQQVGQIAIVFKLNTRPPEGIILNIDQLNKIGYSLKIMKRLE